MFQNYQELLAGYAEFYNCCSNLNQSQELAAGKSNRFVGEDKIEIEIGSFNQLTKTDIFYLATILMNLFLAKNYLSRRLRNLHFLDNLGLRSKDRFRLEECLWRLIFYAFTSCWLIYTCFLKRQAQVYLKSSEILHKYSFALDTDEYLICMIEISFYLHATYAISFEDVWRRDSYMMLIHHLAAIFSVVTVYGTRTHQIGLVAIALRDTCDVLLEVTKLPMCLHIQHGKVVTRLERLVPIFMAIFTTAFVINQLYYYPLFCLFHALNLRKMYNLCGPLVSGILACALVFLLLDLIWFLIILRLIYRKVFTTSPLKDLREYDDEDEEDLKKKRKKKL